MPDRERAQRPIRSYRDLDVWREGIAVVRVVYQLSAAWSADERFGLTSPIRRAAMSVPSTLAEGWGATSAASSIRCYARGSLFEVETQLLVAVEVDLLAPDDIQDAPQRIDRLRRRVTTLRRSL